MRRPNVALIAVGAVLFVGGAILAAHGVIQWRMEISQWSSDMWNDIKTSGEPAAASMPAAPRAARSPSLGPFEVAAGGIGSIVGLAIGIIGIIGFKVKTPE